MSSARFSALILVIISTSVPTLAEDLPRTEGAQARTPPPLNVEFMLRGYFMAGSKIKDRKALGGFARSDNLPKALGERPDHLRAGISLLALTDVFDTFGGEFAGFTVVLVNNTDDTQSFNASDSRLRIIRQATNDKGEWLPIEYLPSSWCGNSYHRVFLEPGQYWSFVAPKYDGTIPTRMRFVLLSKDTEPIYSNEFEGWINLEQFSVKQGHTPTGIMDPYND